MTEAVPSDRELEALKILWEQGRATVREIWERMRDREGKLAYTTVLSLLQVMEQKGLVGHEAVGKAYTYFALVERTATFRTLASGFLERVFDGALDDRVVDDELDANLRDEFDVVFGSTVGLGVAALATEAADLGDRDSLCSGCLQGILHIVEFERLHNRGDELHVMILFV